MTDNEIVKHCTEKNALSFNDINDILSLTSTMGETHTISYGHKGDMREDGSTIKGCYNSLDFHYIDRYELL